MPADPPDRDSDSTEDPDQLWQAATKDVRRLDGREARTGGENGLRPLRRLLRRGLPGPVAEDAPLSDGRTGQDVDHRTRQRFEQGRMTIDARLDLHGRTLAEAHAAVLRFLRAQQAAGHRCVLVITGKGETSGSAAWYESPRGGIRRNFLSWVEAEELKPFVLSVSPAKLPHGGDGAFYVLLRRKR